MSRTVDEMHRRELLDRIVAYVYRHGVSDLSLRPLAAAVDSSPRVLLYYFGSKEEMIAQILGRAREAQRAEFANMMIDEPDSPGSVCRAIWKVMSAPKVEPAFRLFFEVYGLAIQDRKRFAGFLKTVMHDWLIFLEAPRIAAGHSPEDARALASIIIDGFRGFMLDLCATHDRKRIDRAVEIFIALIASVSSTKELARVV